MRLRHGWIWVQSEARVLAVFLEFLHRVRLILCTPYNSTGSLRSIILRSTTNLYNRVTATIISPLSTDDGHNKSSAGREACRQSRLGSSAEQNSSRTFG
ncbi:hypothetical protein F5882DRAFT_421321 [Hyaloscypha sp. PMI_1271]|nr:hypothetical protein F5882DRAFT_421321 [Hyaloscypha sp. PMI_1271]